ncbi:ATP-binding protein [Ktedonospora formicarum]|uniref:IstB-like ATP-binding domain-containing protein n=1 Tax=Ktedonospora formicarum TaxID=2778364 RepID=A0A8J3MST3_9CHLR|nr:ATP-binding protein [Ktedonospora formicarum]GHO46450.1 hypothetical protein KSX_46130 [Ktedonospora formicarum]
MQERLLARHQGGECIGCNHQGVPLGVDGRELPVIREFNGFFAPAEYCDCELGVRYQHLIKREREEYRRQSLLDDYHYACKLFEPALLTPSKTKTGLPYTLESWPLHFGSSRVKANEEYQPAYEARVKLLEAAKNFVKDQQLEDKVSCYGLCLQGYPGVGKTGLILGLAASLAETGQHMLSLYTPLLLSHFQATDQQEKMLSTLRRIPLLFLDNLGDSQSMDPAPYYIRKFLEDIFDARYTTHLPIMVTTNLDAEQLECQFGDAVVSRLRGLCRLVEVPGVDLR